jgi:hypothetical protein
MARWTVHWERRTRIPPAAARAWWFDLQPDDHSVQEHAGHTRRGRAAERRVLSRSATEVHTEDTYGGFTFPTRVWLEGKDTLRWEAGDARFRNRATLRFVPDLGGTRLVCDAENEARGAFGFLAALMKARFIRRSQEDMDLHVRHMEREWAEKPW